MDFLGHPNIQDNAGGGAVLGKCSRRKESLERVASTGRASTKGRSGGLQFSLCVVSGCVHCVIYMCVGQGSIKCSALNIHCVYILISGLYYVCRSGRCSIKGSAVVCVLIADPSVSRCQRQPPLDHRNALGIRKPLENLSDTSMIPQDASRIS